MATTSPTESPTLLNVVLNLANATLSPKDGDNDNDNDQDDGPAFLYNCINPEDEVCAANCTSIEVCDECNCEIIRLVDTGGPWGDVMDVIFCLLPIFYLVVVTVKSNPTPTTVSLPVSAAIMFLVRTMYLGSNPLLTSGCVILGFHEAITPLSIMAGAITLFETMEATKCLPYMMREMKALTAGHPVAEAMLLFAFAYLVEGASGFGTPVALGAPMLVSTGNPPLESVVIMLLFNTFATVWGAVGTPLWFGFGGLQLTEEEYLQISFKAAVAMIFSSFILIPFIMTILVPFAVIKQNLLFLFLAIATVMGPVAGLASVNYEFPSLMGGLIGCGLTAVLIKYKIGLAPYDPTAHQNNNNNNSTNNNEVDISQPPAFVVEVPDLTDMPLLARKVSNLDDDKKDTADNNIELPGEPTQNMTSNGSNTDTDNPAETQRDSTKSTEFANSKGVPSINGTWNVEVTDNPHADDDDARTVVTIEPKTSDASVGGIGGGGKLETTPVTPPPVEEDIVKSQQKQETRTDGTNDEEQAAIKMALTRSQQLEDALGPRKSWKEGYLFEVLLRTFPIWAVVLILILTRVQQIGLKPYLTKQSPYWDVQFGTYGEFRLSVSAVLQLKDILSYPNLNWKYDLFYVPFLIPFVLVSVITMILYRKDMTCKPRDIAATVVSRLSSPAIALMGALTLVQLMIRNGTESPAFLLGTVLAKWLQEGFIVICPLLGALGSFFSGSTTVSNLTFGEIQAIAALSIGTSRTTMLALQAYGGSAGNGICLNNIIAALAVVGLNVSEGEILMRTGKYVFASTTIATAVMLIFFFRFE